MLIRSLVTAVSSAALTAVALALPSPASAAATPITITAVERGSGAPVPGACYSVVDRGRGGGSIAGGCDNGQNGDAVAHDGTVVLTTERECEVCEVVQTLPNLAPGVVTNHLLEPMQTGGWQDYQFSNYLKPYLQVAFVDARTDVPLTGACIGINKTGEPGGIYAGCDGNDGGGAGDQDGAANGVVETRRLPTAGTYTVGQPASGAPDGYLVADPFDVDAPPAETGDVVTRTVQMIGNATLLVRAVNKKGKPLDGACYAVKDATLGAGLGRICDGRAGDDDGKTDGVVRLADLPWGHRYVADQKSAPKDYKPARKSKSVTTEPGEQSVLRFTNRGGGSQIG